jgi:hypothetical protein
VSSLERAANTVCEHIGSVVDPPPDCLGTMILDLSEYYQHLGSSLAQSNLHCQGLQMKLMRAVATDYALAHWRNKEVSLVSSSFQNYHNVLCSLQMKRLSDFIFSPHIKVN